MINRFTATLFCLFICLATLAQSNKDELDETAKQNKKNTSRALDPLRPAKAAFYSAVLPGLGQAYNKKYWKIPIVYGAIGTGLYFYLDNNKLYQLLQQGQLILEPLQGGRGRARLRFAIGQGLQGFGVLK